MSLRSIYETLQKKQDSIVQKITSYHDFLKHFDLKSVPQHAISETSNLENGSLGKSVQESSNISNQNNENSISEEEEAELSRNVLAFRQYMYDQYVFDGEAVEKSPPYYIMGKSQLDEALANGKSITLNVALTYRTIKKEEIESNEDSYLIPDLKSDDIEQSIEESNSDIPSKILTYIEANKLKQDKLLDLLEPTIVQKQKEIDTLKSKPSVMKQAIQKQYHPQRIWNTENEEINALYDHLYRVWKIVYNHPSAWPFYKPVTEDVAPQYYDIITNPIDLSTMQKCLRNLTYSSKQEFFNDIYLMCENCRTYNTDLESPFRQKGNEIEDLARMLQRTVPDIIVIDKSGNETIEKIEKQPETRNSQYENSDIVIADYISSYSKWESEVSNLKPDVSESIEEKESTEEAETIESTTTTRRRRGRGREPQAPKIPVAPVETEKDRHFDFLLPSNSWFQKSSKLRNSYLYHRYQQKSIPFEDQIAVERTEDSMGSYILERNGFDIILNESSIKVEDGQNNEFGIQQNENSKFKIVRKTPSSFIPEYIFTQATTPDPLFPGKRLSSAIPNINDTAQGALVLPIQPKSLPRKEKENYVFDLLKWDNPICKQTQKLLQLQKYRLQKMNFNDVAEEIYDISDEKINNPNNNTLDNVNNDKMEDITDNSSINTKKVGYTSSLCPMLEEESSMRGLVALFAAHSGFTHITSEASDILIELVDTYMLTLGRNINHFLFINPEIKSHIAALRVLGVMEERRSIPVMKKEWDNRISDMEQMIERSLNKYHFPNNTLTGNSSNNTIGESLLVFDSNIDLLNNDQQIENDLKRKREDGAFSSNKKQNIG